MIDLDKTVELLARESPITNDELDEMVCEVFSRRAAAVNNEGRRAQIRFLLTDGYTSEDLTKR